MKGLIGAILMAASTVAMAAPTPSAGTAKASDFTLKGAAANGFAFAKANGQAGPNGNPTVFNNTFTGSWSLLGKFGSAATLTGPTATFSGADFTVSLNLGPAKTSGTWSIAASKSMTLDLVLGMHAGGATGSFLFNNVSLTAGQSQSGTFAIHWLNNGGQVPAYSNLTMFYKNAALTNVAAVPEPATYGMLLGGLAVVGVMARRRRRRDATADNAMA